MKFAFAVFVALTLFGCSYESAPTAPNPPGSGTPGGLTSLWGMVVETSGLCIEDAMVEVVRGQAQGQRMTQETPCDAWAYSGGFVFKELSPGVEMTVRASAPGWSTGEKTFVPQLRGQTVALISLEKL